MTAPGPGNAAPAVGGIPGCHVLDHPVHADARGTFAKPFTAPQFAAVGLATTWAECFWSRSHRGAVRGFHVQLPPAEHAKLLWAVAGSSCSAVVDLRVGSPAYGRPALITLSAAEGRALYVPPGVAHAFQALADDTVLVYLVSSAHDPARDAGVRYDSAGVAWPLPVAAISPRDGALPPLASFESPFRYAP
jgi:dTDP-4-dehydrorhamnose 3,5-epimerase